MMHIKKHAMNMQYQAAHLRQHSATALYPWQPLPGIDPAAKVAAALQVEGAALATSTYKAAAALAAALLAVCCSQAVA